VSGGGEAAAAVCSTCRPVEQSTKPRQGGQEREREKRETEWVARALEHYQGEWEMVGPRRDGDEGGLIETEVRAR
jgi:hypothetical protein